jgi:1,4-dihydroxy-2-naphthoate octaprenyltransferase
MSRSSFLLMVSTAVALALVPLLVGLMVLMHHNDVHPLPAALVCVAVAIAVAKVSARRINLYADHVIKGNP